MKKFRFVSFILAIFCVLVFSACSGEKNADVLMHETKSNAEKIENCTADISNTLEFTANDKKYTYKTSNESVYFAEPFALKSSQTTLIGNKTDNFISYTVNDKDGIWFYSNTENGWQKTLSQSIIKTPLEQIDILRLLQNLSSQKYVRETTLGSEKVHKIELTFKSEVLRSTIETIVTSTGIGQQSETIVPVLLDSIPDIYGYCYIDIKSGNILRMELNAEDALNKTLKNIDGSMIKINVSKCEIVGNIKDIGKTPPVELPPEATDAKIVKAAG